MISLSDNSAQIAETFRRVNQAIDNPAPLMRIVAGIMHDEVEENFAQEGRPKWMGLKPPVNPRRQGGKILQDTGQLAASIVQGYDSHNAWVGTNKKYAAIQHFGSGGLADGKTSAHVILPRNKKALAFAGRVVKRVNHPGSKIPARPFLLVTPMGEQKIISAANNYLAKVIP